MKLFGLNAVETETEKRRRQADEEARTIAEIDALAKAAEAEALSDIERLARLAALHEADVSAYRFDCRRWGNFLSLFCERLTYQWDGGWKARGYVTKTYATSVNIRETRELRMIAGAAPDLNGEIGYRLSMVKIDGTGSSWGTDYGRFPAPEGSRYDVRADVPSETICRPLFALDKSSPDYDSSMTNWGDGCYRPTLRTKFARAAVDDRIRFEGIGATVFLPAGLGQVNYERMLGEIG